MGSVAEPGDDAPPGAAPRPPAGGRAAPRRPEAEKRRSYARPVYGRLGVGSVLGRSLAVYGRNLIPFTLLSLVVNLPLLLYTWLTWTSIQASPTTMEGMEQAARRLLVWSFVFLFGGGLLGLVTAGPVTYGVVEQLRGRRPGIGACMRVGLRRLPRILLVALRLLFLVIVFAVVFVLVLSRPIASFFGTSELGGFLGQTVIQLPVLLIFCVFWVAIPAAVVEDVTAGKALARSMDLTRRNVWKILAVLFLIQFAEWGAGQLVSALTEEPIELADLGPRLLASVLLSVLLFGPVQAVCAAIGYHDLRTTKEGIGVDELASVFD